MEYIVSLQFAGALVNINYVQGAQYFFKHLVFIISTVNMEYKIHVIIISTSIYSCFHYQCKVQV